MQCLMTCCDGAVRSEGRDSPDQKRIVHDATVRACVTAVLIVMLRTSQCGETGLGPDTPSTCAGKYSIIYLPLLYNNMHHLIVSAGLQ